MKRTVIGMCLVLVIIAGVSLFPGRAQEAQTPTKNWAAGNPLKIGLLKWYQANLATPVSPWARHRTAIRTVLLSTGPTSGPPTTARGR